MLDIKKVYSFNFPTPVRFGAGVIKELGSYLKDNNLSSFYLRIIWKGSGSSTNRNNSILSEKPICGCKNVRLLDRRELPRELRDVCMQRHSIQS